MSQALLFGISGLVGSATAPLLASQFDRVVAPVRKPYCNTLDSISTPVIDFNELNRRHQNLFQNTDCLVYALGTTLKKAGSVQNFRAIEWGLASTIATLARHHNIKRFVLLSASGTSPDSMIPYTKIKGEIERFVQELGFRELIIAKPSLLVGDRAETRLIEGISVKLTRPLLKPLQRYLPKFAPIQDIQVARALAAAATLPMDERVIILENEDLLELAGPPIVSVIDVKT